MRSFHRPCPEGYPWVDYKESTKTGTELRFFFKIENFLYFLLREICISYPCAVNGRTQLPLYSTANVTSASNLSQPIPIPPELFSSPSQNFNQGALDEDPQGFRIHPYVWNYPFSKGDFLTVSVTGATTGIVIGCMIIGRKTGGV